MSSCLSKPLLRSAITMECGPRTPEYRTLQENVSKIVDSLSATVDPGSLALKLHEIDLVARSTIDSANITHGMTPAQRIRPVLTAILAQVELNASKYHDFVTVLKHFNPVLTDVLCDYFSKLTHIYNVYKCSLKPCYHVKDRCTV